MLLILTNSFHCRDAFSSESFFDYDQCEYVIERMSDEPDLLKFGFNSNCSKQILEHGGVEMLEELYKDNQIDKSRQLERCDITLGIDTSNIPQTQSKLASSLLIFLIVFIVL